MRSMLVALFSMAVFAATAQANLLDDGSFGDATDDTQTSGSNWVMTADNPSGNAGEESARFSTSAWASADSDGGVWFQSFRGNQGGGGTPTADASITQTLVAPQNGDYDLTFQWVKELNFSAGSMTALLSSSGSGGSDSLDLLAGPSVPTGGGFADHVGEVGSLSLAGVTAGDILTVSVAMVGGFDALADPQSFMVDNFDLTFIPEPTSVALVGLGLLGLLGIRRRR